MTNRRHLMKVMVAGLRVFAVLALVVTGWFGAVIPTTAQNGDVAAMDIGAHGPNGHEIGARFTVTTLGGDYIGSCTLEGHGDEPYLVSCRVNVPRGTTVVVTLDIDTITSGTAPVENPLYFDTSTNPGAASSWGVTFQIEPIGRNASTGQTSDIAIVTMENGQPAYDACYVLVNFSNEGCDRNGDGEITFQDVPLGTYTLRQTANLGPGRSVQDSTITITGATDADGWERIYVTIGTSSGQTEAVDIALITRAPEDGHLLTTTCYVLVGYSNEGCDENGDGQVTFADIPAGIYTVRQTQTPAGYATINNFDIMVESIAGGIPLGFVVRQSPEQNAADSRNVSVVFVDSRTGARVVSEICVEFVGASNVGCDQDLRDGQIDFLDVPAGTHDIEFSNIPAGWQVLTPNYDGTYVTVDAAPDTLPQVMIFFEVYVP